MRHLDRGLYAASGWTTSLRSTRSWAGKYCARHHHADPYANPVVVPEVWQNDSREVAGDVVDDHTAQ